MNKVQTINRSISIEIASAFICSMEQSCLDLMRDNAFVERVNALRDYIDNMYDVGEGNEIRDMFLTIEYAPERPLTPTT